MADDLIADGVHQGLEIGQGQRPLLGRAEQRHEQKDPQHSHLLLPLKESSKSKLRDSASCLVAVGGAWSPSSVAQPPY